MAFCSACFADAIDVCTALFQLPFDLTPKFIFKFVLISENRKSNGSF
jgi:hypothetical protein